MEQHQHSHSDGIYTCPMHPEETGKKGDKCPKCGMDLVPVSDENASKVEVKLHTEPQTIEAGTSAKLTFAFQENNKHVPLDISHEMKVHLMIVDENLSWFRHIHPEEQADGSYTIAETFPNGGKYILFSDFKPQGAASVVDKKEIIVKGSSDSKADFSTKLVSVVDGYTVTLENGKDLKTNRSQALEISVVKDGKKLTESDIQPYLAATAHIAMVSKENKDFLHIHPISDDRFPIYAETHIKKTGTYRIWVEFQTNGKVHTADFTVDVAEGEKNAHDDGHHGHHEH
ncbi:hypothetical protein BC792_12036 [Sphingobacterium allocomposti]|uniref:Heavy metal binding domain-containing protein n=2 Tax=Sphingobacterium allocomposti TaxID=415956 RepID=A0A5S5D7M4_9SPHI|nr:hypothetical protein BC792_12036 [Sphingobacterium composti Yoo et al. 2007 non Ten et al. 2007]